MGSPPAGEPSGAVAEPPAAHPSDGAAITRPALQQQPQAAGEPLSPAAVANAEADPPTLLGEALLPGSSDEGSPTPWRQQAPALTAEEAERRKRRRERWEKEAEAKQRWELQRRLVDISTHVELLAREVERMRSEMDVPLPLLSELSDGERSQLEALRRKRVTDLLANHCKKALGHITSHKWSWPFNAPVDLRQYPDYGQTITHPMDFGTVKRRLDCSAYRHPDEFLVDVRLVFDNARLYNKPGSDVHVMANTLQERFEEKYAASVAPRVAEEAVVARCQVDEARRRHMEASTKDAGDALEQHCAVLVKYIDEVQACILDARSVAASLCKPVSREDKVRSRLDLRSRQEALVQALTSMPQDQFELAVGLVMSHHPGLQAYDDFGFDLDALDALTLRQMQSFVRVCEAVEAEAKQHDGTPASVSWPQLLLGSGLRPYRLAAPTINKRQKKQHDGAAVAGMQQPEVHVKQEQQQQQLPPPPQQKKKRPVAAAVGDALPLTSTLSPQKVAASALAAGLISPQAGVLPPMGSAVGPKPLTLPTLPSAAPKQQQREQKKAAGSSEKAAAALPAVASSAPVAALGVAAAPKQSTGAKPGPSMPTAAQIAAVANAGPQQQHLLAQMHSLLSQVQMTQAATAQQASVLAAANAKTAGRQQQQQQRAGK